MKVVVSGASGFLGSALVPALRADGHEVVRLVRRPARAADEVSWNPARRELEPRALERVEAVVNLSGAGLGDHRWSEEYKQVLRASRIDATSTLAAAIAERPDRPRVFLSASAVGIYGDTGDTAIDEAGPLGTDFLARLCRDWEEAAAPARDAGVRTVHLRSGLVLAASGGMLGRIRRLFQLGVGGRLGSGRQWFSWIALPDHIAALRFLLGSDDIAGAVNLTAPEPVRNREFTAALARAVRRPAVIPVPRTALRLVLGELADLGALISQRVLPGGLEAAGFDFTYPDIDAALRALL